MMNWRFFRLRLPALSFLPLLIFGGAPFPVSGFDERGNQFIGFTRFNAFETSPGSSITETVLTSKGIVARIPWNELVASWNANMPRGTYLKIEVRALYLDHPTKYYVMGLWSESPERHPRESVRRQKDDDGDVSTDTLILKQPCERFQIRLTFGGENLERAKLKLLGISLTDSKASPGTLPPNRHAWGRVIDVPERSQMAYPNGGVLCSPTTVSMLMTHWSRALNRPEIDRDVPEIVKEVYDPNWRGTGNWPFNTAYAGSFKGMRGYVTRLSDISELEDWIARGIPVGLSVCYDRLRGKGPGPSGHLVVCVGFTKNGDPVINDPGTSKNVRKIFPRKKLEHAWAYSHNTVYLIYPEDADVPRDRFGHWNSWSSKQRIKFER